jgi:hypothetical protein
MPAIQDLDSILKKVHALIEEIRSFFEELTPERNIKAHNYDELAGWYEEARYTFRRIEYACKNNNFAECFHLGAYLQVELDILTEESALEKMDLLGSYDADNLAAFEKRAK